MGYYVSHMFGIKAGGVFSGDIDMEDFNTRLQAVYERYTGEPGKGITPGVEQTGNKGAYIVLAGTYNYWLYPHASRFASMLSEEFGTEVMHMCWDEQKDEVQCQIWLGGKPLFEVNENPIGQILRRIC